MIKNISECISYISKWLYYAVTNANKIGYAIGISGGIDSAVVAALCRKTGYKVLGVYMPCYSNEEDEIHAKLLCTSLNLNLIIEHIKNIKTVKKIIKY